jgi:hypothetical protein
MNLYRQARAHWASTGSYRWRNEVNTRRYETGIRFSSSLPLLAHTPPLPCIIASFILATSLSISPIPSPSTPTTAHTTSRDIWISPQHRRTSTSRSRTRGALIECLRLMLFRCLRGMETRTHPPPYGMEESALGRWRSFGPFGVMPCPLVPLLWTLAPSRGGSRL